MKLNGVLKVTPQNFSPYATQMHNKIKIKNPDGKKLIRTLSCSKANVKKNSLDLKSHSPLSSWCKFPKDLHFQA